METKQANDAFLEVLEAIYRVFRDRPSQETCLTCLGAKLCASSDVVARVIAELGDVLDLVPAHCEGCGVGAMYRVAA